MNFVIQVVFWILVIYGFCSLIQDIFYEVTYKVINHDLKIIVMVKNVEKNISGFLIKLKKMKMENLYQQIIVIDLDSDLDIAEFRKRLTQEEINVTLLDRADGKKIINDYFQNKNKSFFE
jgi:ethanolamine utilization protein EutP (predicted NTPase)